MRVIQGIDTGALPDQFESALPGRVLIVDGDGPCYVAAATAKRLDTAVRRFQQEILKRMFLTKAEDCRIHLTAHNSDKHGRFRVKAVKPYQGNRTNKAKPALLEPLREAVADNSTWLPEYSVLMHRELEADDGMMQDAYALGERGVTWSEDKDLRMTPYLYYELNRGQVMPSQPHGWVSITHTNSGVAKLVGQGPMFFWGQMLMGDQADHIQGILRMHGEKCGAVGAFKALEHAKTQSEAANIVIDGYRAIDQNPIPEGWLLWLTRYPGDNVLKYLAELALTPENAEFVRACSLRDWATPREAANERDVNT